MADREEAEGEGQGLDEILRAAAAGVLRRAEDEKAGLRARIAELESEVKFLRGGTSERRYELRFAPRDKLHAGEEDVTSARIDTPGGATHVVAVQSPHGTQEVLEGLHGMLPDGVIVVGLPPGTEISVLELVPARGGG